MKKVLSYILSFILLILISLIVLIMCVQSDVLNKNSLFSAFDKVNYYQNTYNALNEMFLSYVEQSGLEDEVMNDIISIDEIKEEVKNCIDSIFEGKEYAINSDNLKQRLNDNITKYLEKDNRKANENERKSIEEFVSKISDIYCEEVFPMSIVTKIESYIAKIIKFIDFVKPILFISVAVITIILIIINIKNILFVLNYIGVSLFGSGLLLMVPKLIVDKNMRLNELSLFNQNISSFIVTIATNILEHLKELSFILLVVSVIILICNNFIIKKLSKNTK